MKSIFLLIFSATFLPQFWVTTQHQSEIDLDLQGAWEAEYSNDDGKLVQIVSIIQGDYIAQALFNKEEKEFYQTLGGTWKVVDDELIIDIHFDSKDSSNVGKLYIEKYSLSGDEITFENGERRWNRIDGGDTGALANPWFFSGRMRNGEMSRRTLRPRKTMKILSDTRFQWIAYNDETGKFSGTGGGTYTFKDGKYTEHIEFFSRDGNRVGASLSFEGEVKEREWHHKGFSSKGDPMYEIWAPIEMIKKEE